MRFNFKTYDSFKNVLSDCYIAKRVKLEKDKYGNSIPIYSKANEEPYHWNIQPVDVDSYNESFGERVHKMKVAMLVGEEAERFKNEFDEFDLAYLDGATPKDENENNYGSKANYKIYVVKQQNVASLIYFEKII